MVATHVLANHRLVSAWHLVGTASLAAVLDTVRTRILSFVLKIEREIPPARANDDMAIAEILPSHVEHHFHTTIIGDVSQLAVGSGAQQNMTLTQIAAGDTAGLRARLAELKVPDHDVNALELALAEDRASGTTGAVGEKTTGWLGRMVMKAGSGVWKVGSDVAANTLTSLIQQYLGLKP